MTMLPAAVKPDLDILVKDLRSVQSCAADAGLSLPVAACVLEQILGAWPPK